MNDLRYFAIINSRIKSSLKSIITDFLKQHSIDFVETKKHSHAIEAAKDTSGYSGIIAIGGDGTLHEVINGIDTDKQAVLPVPAGTLNGIAYQLGIKNSFHALHQINNGKIYNFDLMDVTFEDSTHRSFERKCIGFLAIGKDGKVAELSHKFRKVHHLVRYPVCGIISALSVKVTDCSICINKSVSEKKKVSSLLINNGAANFFSTIKKWDLQDGFAEMHISSQWWLPHLLWNLVCISPYCGSFMSGVETVEAKWENPLSLMVDGECFRNIVSLHVNVRPRSLKIILPEFARIKR